MEPGAHRGTEFAKLPGLSRECQMKAGPDGSVEPNGQYCDVVLAGLLNS